MQFFRSDDGGKTFKTKIKVPHGDNHDLWIASNDDQRMIEANDGGANVSTNGGQDLDQGGISDRADLPRDDHRPFPYLVCGAQQDNTTICVPSKDWKHMNVLGGQYGFSVGGGESGYIANDPIEPEHLLCRKLRRRAQSRSTIRTGRNGRSTSCPTIPWAIRRSDIPERFQWTYPIVFDPQDKNTLYATSQHVWKSTNAGQSWEKISPDLTRHDPATLGPSGGPITLDQTGVETYGTVFALPPSRLEPDVIWAGSDDGLVHVTRDNGRTWADVTPEGIPEISQDHDHRGFAEPAGNGVPRRATVPARRPAPVSLQDHATTGSTGRSIANGIPADEMVHSIREDPARPGLLYLGTERGVWISFDDGLSWQKLQRNLPVTQVADLAVTDHDLVIATHGRSFWVLDNIDVLRQLDRSSGNARCTYSGPRPRRAASIPA